MELHCGQDWDSQLAPDQGPGTGWDRDQVTRVVPCYQLPGTGHHLDHGLTRESGDKKDHGGMVAWGRGNLV